MTNEAYIRDEHFEVMLCTYKIGMHGEIRVAVGYADIKQQLQHLDWSTIVCFSHNAVFDMSVLSWRLGITPRYMLCTMSLWIAVMGVRYRASLKVCAEALGLPAKGDEVVRMDGLHLCELTTIEQAAYIRYGARDTELCYQISLILLPLFTETELLNCHAAIQMYVLSKLVLHIPTLEKAQIEEHTRRANIYRICAEHLNIAPNDKFIKSILSSSDKFKALLEVLKVEIPYKKTTHKVKGTDKREVKMIPAFARTDAAFEALLESEDPIVADLCEARLLAKSTQAETRVDRFLAIARRGTLPTPIQYAGAAVTQRYGAAVDRINLQNLKRKSLLRYAVQAPQGYKIVGGDLSQLELRFGLLVAGEYEKLKLFAQGHDPYKQIMTDTFDIPYDGMSDSDRQVGKVVNLSAIFGTGVDRVREIIRLQAKRIISEEDAQQLIRVYREQHPALRKAWQQGVDVLEGLLIGQTLSVWHNGWGRVVAPDANNLFNKYGALYRPGGLRIQYPELKRQQGQWPDGRLKDEYVYLRQRERGGSKTLEYIYGSKVFQNFVQAGSRDVIANAIANIMRNIPEHWYLVGQVHDELWVLVPDAEVEVGADWLRTMLTTPPTWAQELPLACSIYIADSYGAGK